MATRRSINVKIPTAKVIEALETRKAEIITDRDEYPAKKREFEKADEAWKAKVAKIASKKEIAAISVNERNWLIPREATIAVHYNLIGEQIPERPEMPIEFGYRQREALEEIENAIRILKMTEQEEVSTSTYNAVAKYL